MTHPLLPPPEAEAVAEYVTWLQACNSSEKTIRARRSFAAARLRDWSLSGFTRANVLEYLAHLNRRLADEEISEWTLSTYGAHMRSLSVFLQLGGYIEEDPLRAMPKPKRPKSVPNSLTDAEVARILDVAQDEDLRDFILLGLFLGLRAHEIAKIKGEHVRPNGIYVKGKGAVKAVLPIHPVIAEVIQRRPEVGFWFPGSDRGHIPSSAVSARIGELYRSQRIAGSSHRNRHTFITNLARQGTHVTRIQQLARHASLATTQGYMQIVKSDLDDAVFTLPDFGLLRPAS